MSEQEPKNSGDLEQPKEIDLTQEFFSATPSEFRQKIDDELKKNERARIVVRIPPGTVLSQPQQTLLRNLEFSQKVKVIR